MSSNDYKETPRAYLQRALGDLDNARSALASCLNVPSENDVKWTLRNVGEHLRHAQEMMDFYKHEVNNGPR